jgi:lauroyl/myristoyl acyltransferase
MQFDNIKDEAQSTAQMNQILEELILIEPTQYMWTLRIFGKYKDDKR